MYVRGEAGTGKSRIIKCLQNDPASLKHVRFVAPTGVAACQIGGRTMSSELMLPVGNSRRHVLNGEARRRVERRWPKDEVRLLIIDATCDIISLSQHNVVTQFFHL